MHSFRRSQVQRSEAFSTMAFLTLSGGLQDAYTYFVRDGVFANAQTGNIVLMSVRAFSGDLAGVLRYLIPLTAFALGVFAAEMLRQRERRISVLHWRQLVVLAEILLLFLVGFLRNALNILGVNPYWQGTAIGAVIVVAVLAEKLSKVKVKKGK